MKFIAGVHNAIAQCPASIALVSSKIYQSFAPLTATMPYLIGNREMNDLDLYIDNVEPEIAEKVKQFDKMKPINILNIN